MAIQSIEQLRASSQEIKNEVVKKANSATRVGGFLENFVDTFEDEKNKIVDTNDEQFAKLNNEGIILQRHITKALTVDDAILINSFGGRYGTPTNPIKYKLLVDRTNGKEDNKVVIDHSSLILPEFLESALIQTWGTRPDWFKLTGDTYLVGEAHLNRLELTFHEYYWNGISYDKNVVVCNIKAITNGNEYVGDKDQSVLLKMNFNDNKNSVSDPSLLNESVWGNELLPYIENPQNVSWTDLGGGDYALRLIKIGADQANAAKIRVPVTPFMRKLTQRINKVSFVAKIRTDDALASDTEMFLLTCIDWDTSSEGFRFSIRNQENRVRARINGSNYGPNNDTFNIEVGKWFWVGYVFTGTQLKFYLKAPDYTVPIPFQLHHTSSVSSKTIALTTATTAIRFNSESAPDPIGNSNFNIRDALSYSFAYLALKELSDAEVEAMMV